MCVCVWGGGVVNFSPFFLSPPQTMSGRGDVAELQYTPRYTLMCLSIGTPKAINFPLSQMKN